MDMKKLEYTETQHTGNHGDFQNVIIQVKFMGINFYQPAKMKSIFNYSYRLAKWRILRNIKQVIKGDIFEQWDGKGYSTGASGLDLHFVTQRSEQLSDFEKWLNDKEYDSMWTKHLISEYKKLLNCG